MATTNFNNQKFIRIIRKEIKDISVILNNLSSDGFFLYSYIKNQPTDFALSNKNSGLTEYKYNKAVKELIEKGFLKETSESTMEKRMKIWDFYEDPFNIITKKVPNQRSICIKKEENVQNITFSYQAMFYAMKTLSANEFKTWCYFSSLNPQLSQPLSTKDILDKCNFSHETYRTVIKELTNKGFLILDETTKTFTFYENPNSLEDISNISKDNFYLYKYVSNDTIIYIGQTSSLKRRVQQHTQDKLYNFKGEIYYTNCGSKKELDLLEAILINKYKPEFNIAHKNREDLNYDLIKDNLNLDWILYKTIE